MANVPGSDILLGVFVTAFLHRVVLVILAFDCPTCDSQRSI